MITKFTERGIKHCCDEEENQDVILSGNNKRFTVITLADGVSTCKKGRRGAEIASEETTNLLIKYGDYFISSNEDKIIEQILGHILFRIKKEAKKESIEFTEFSSTIASILFDKKRKKIMFFSLGDSLILTTYQNKCRAIAMPHSNKTCCCTTTLGAEKVASVTIMDSSLIESAVICSDGAWRIMYDRNNLNPEILKIINNHDYSSLKEYLAKKKNNDDCSFISMGIEHKERNKIDGSSGLFEKGTEYLSA